ncbi:MAG: type II toxin-antitoxin system VapC family toxin [Bauldia sp.]|nr:type II toxin-antitoxin system VapC family toxin [Bauldia sp.]MCW5716781.1 type II toxin-antitoxin system VapC family toxin [Bauldia sp.]
MIILDTNVLSELIKGGPTRSPVVASWFRARALSTLVTTTPAIAELRAGVEVLPDGARKHALEAGIGILLTRFEGRILPFGPDAARAFGKIVARRRRTGMPTSDPFDLQIAAIARVAGMAVATRNVMDFQECGVEMVDPWTARSP